MRRPAAFLLLVLVLLVAGGRSLLFRIQLAEVRSAARDFISRGGHLEAATVFRLTAADSAALTWLDDGREFDRDGKRYDVLTISRANGLLHICAIEDRRETELVIRFQQAPHQPGPSSELVKLLSIPFVLPVQAVLPAEREAGAAALPHLSASPPVRSLSVSTPPPQCVCAS